MADQETNPSNMLPFYRQASDQEMNAEVQKFLALTPDERMELLFYIVMHTTRMLRMLHEKVDPEGFEVMTAPTLDKPN